MKIEQNKACKALRTRARPNIIKVYHCRCYPSVSHPSQILGPHPCKSPASTSSPPHPQPRSALTPLAGILGGALVGHPTSSLSSQSTHSAWRPSCLTFQPLEGCCSPHHKAGTPQQGIHSRPPTGSSFHYSCTTIPYNLRYSALCDIPHAVGLFSSSSPTSHALPSTPYHSAVPILPMKGP